MNLRSGRKMKVERPRKSKIVPVNVTLPAEVWVHTLGLMNSKDLKNVRKVCKTWNTEAIKILNKRTITWREPDYSDQEWFDRETTQCQVCGKQFDDPAQASTCVTGHKRLRCYICFGAVRDTEALYTHFIDKHGGDDYKLSVCCPYCKLKVPFKSLSCHVISVHLVARREQKRANQFMNNLKIRR